MESISQKFAGFATGLTFSDISRDHIHKIKTYFLDWLGSALAGKDEPPVKIMLEVANELGGKPECTVIPDGSRTMCLLAAMVNAASSHVVEMDDLHRESIFHPAAPIMPAVFAAAERERVTGRDLIVAILVGYEIGIRVAVGVGKAHYQRWHTTATCGTFGAAAGSAKILGLGEEQFVWALGSAGTQSSGLWEFLVESAMSKQLHPANAAMSGLLSSLLASKGFTGARRILEGEKGFFRATSRDFDERKCVEELGREFLFTHNSLKYYASCGHTHSAIEAVLRATGGKPMAAGDIREVRVSIYEAAFDLLGEVKPITPYLAKFSFPFCVATALRHAHVETVDFTPKRLEDPEIHALMKLVQVHTDPELTREYPRKWPARVEIITREGKTLKGASDYPKGDQENPLEEGEVIGKFMTLTEGILPSPRARAIVDRIMNLEDFQDVSRLLDV